MVQQGSSAQSTARQTTRKFIVTEPIRTDREKCLSEPKRVTDKAKLRFQENKIANLEIDAKREASVLIKTAALVPPTVSN